MIHGRNLLIKIGAKNVAFAKSCKININQSFIEACSPIDGRVKEKIPTDYSWGMTTDGLVSLQMDVIYLASYLRNGTKVRVFFIDAQTGQGFTGMAYIGSVDESGSVGNIVTFSASIEGSGALDNVQFLSVQDLESGSFGYSNSSLTYNASGTTGTVGKQFELSSGTHTITAYAYGAVGIVKDTFNNLESLLGHDDWDRGVIDEGLLKGAASGAGMATFTISQPGTYTIVGNKSGLTSFFII
jgi:predicted secreted protein